MSSVVAALLLPFDAPPPERAFFLRAQADPALEGWRGRLECEQSFKPEHDRLAAQGFKVGPRLDGGDFPLGLCATTKHKAESLALIARAWSLLRPGGLLVAAGAADEGAASILKAAAAALGGETASKYHCRIWWARKGDHEAPPGWAEGDAIRRVPETGFLARPGIYGWNKVDAGSRLLADSLPASMPGRVADLGAGWGFLSARMAQVPGMSALDMIEAEALALDCARANLAERAPPFPVRALWLDAAAGIGESCYEWVVTNPPFHAGKAADASLGRAFIAAAARALVRGGRLLLVANRHLPYESEIDARLSRRRLVAENAAFKVIEAVKS